MTKETLRKCVLEKRKLINHTKQDEFASKSAEIFSSNISLEKENIISSYTAYNHEINPKFINKDLLKKKITLCLPVIVEFDHHLIFREYNKNTDLITNKFNIKEPTPDSPKTEPDILIIPLLAFDNKGFRLGYGGGFYDRTIEFLKKNKKICCIGLAYECQHIDTIPTDEHDQKLDYVITEKNCYKF